MPKKQRTAVIILAIVSVIIVISFMWYFNFQLTKPFDFGEEKKNDYNAEYFNPEKIDIDGDGLSNSDETSIYNTSPYLEDTDSDGIDDKVEIERGTDPNCPEGEVCNNLQEAEPVDQLKDIELPQLDSSDVDEDALRQTLQGQVDVRMIREILSQSGVDDEILKGVSDEDLMKSYQEVLNNQNNQQDESSSQ